jgi:uracil-DNA glycosylase family protein
VRRVLIEPTVESWQQAARGLLRAGVPPAEVSWVDATADEPPRSGLPAAEPAAPAAPAPPAGEIRVPRRFLEVAHHVASHRDPDRWALLYGVLWRIVHETPQLLTIEADEQVARLLAMERQVRRGANAMTASDPRAARAERPARYRSAAPETREIPGLLAETPTPGRRPVERAAEPPGARPFVPESDDPEALRRAAVDCTGCDLHRQATQTVFGLGPPNARIVLVGEQPGDQEDLQGAPFVGPAGDVLDRALADVGLVRGELYVTNAVKHFKFVERGKRRIHQKPTMTEVAACRPWLEAELRALKPTIVVCLGATAAQALLGAQFRLMRERGRFLSTPWAPKLLATLHPSAVLRAEEPEQQAELYALLVQDLRTVAAAARAT